MVFKICNSLLKVLLLLFSLLLAYLTLDRIKAKTIQNSLLRILLVRKIHRSHLLIIQIFNGKVGQKSSISKSMSSQVNFFSCMRIMNIIFTPLRLPFLRFESYWEGASHLNCLAYWEIRGCFMVEKSENSIIEINRSASEFNLVDIIVLLQSQCLNFADEIICLKQILSTGCIFRKTPFFQEISDLLKSCLLLRMSLLICR